MLEPTDTATSISVEDSTKDLMLFRFVQLLMMAGGIGSIMWALVSSEFRDSEGFPKGSLCLPLSVGMGLIIVGCTITGRWKKPALWFALALVGQAVSLQMIDAGRLIHYQHYESLNELVTGTGPLLLSFMAIQIGFVIVGVGKRWPIIKGWIRPNFKSWQLLGVSSIFVLSSAALSRGPLGYLTELFIATFV